MKNLYRILILCLLPVAFSSCKGNSSGVLPNSTTLILGKWNLQQQKTVIYANGAVQLDTTCVTSFMNVSRARFNKDNTFNSVGLWSGLITGSNTNLGGSNPIVTAIDSTAGTYTIVNSSLNTTAALAGLRNMVGFYDAASSSGTVITPVNMVSRSLQITLLTSSKLNLHYESVYNTIINNVTTNYKEEEDYYYTR